MPEMTPLEAAEIIEGGICGQLGYDAAYIATVYLRAIAAGEYKRVVRGRWKRQYKSGVIVSSGFVCSACDCWGGERETGFCPRCGALMDGGKNNG